MVLLLHDGHIHVYQILLTKYAGQADFAVGAAFTDRRTSELHHTMGYLTTLLPVRTIPAASHFADMVERMSRNILLLSDNSLPLNMIGNCLEEKRANGTGPLIRFAFGLEDMPTPLDVPDEWTTASPFDLSLSVYRRGNDYSYHYQYATDCFDTAFLTAFSESFDTALLYLTAHPEKDIRTCPLLPPHKIADIAATFRIGPSARPRPDVVTSFEETAEARPDREASVWNGRRTSYGELRGMSGRMAAAIRRRLNSVDGQPMPIGIRLQEKNHLLAGILGILKSGNSYVPLDAGLPQERLEFILKDAMPPSPEELDRYLRTCLPAYMVPTAWRVVDGFPMTMNGKIDKAALPEAQPLTSGLHTLPDTPEEATLAYMAGKLLEAEAPGVTDDLFDLGLTSLQVMELVFEARGQGIFLSATDIYKERCIRNILARRKGDYFYWQGHSQQADKPLMVLLGNPSFAPHYDAFVKLFGVEYDIFVFESFADTLQGEPGCNASELVRHYHRVVMQELGGRDVSVIAGYCLGGELALLLAEALRTDGMPHVKALVIDSFLLRDKRLPLPGVNTGGPTQERDRIIAAIIETLPQPAFGGDLAVCLTKRPYLFRANDGQLCEMPEVQAKNREDWKRAYPHALYCEVDTDHDHVFEEKSMAILHETIKRHWTANDTKTGKR